MRGKKYEYYGEDYSNIFTTVIETALTSVLHIGPGTARYGDDTGKRIRADLGAEFRVDVQHATQAAIGKHPELQAAFRWLLRDIGNLRNDGEKPKPGHLADTIQRCGRVFMARRLHPAGYFRRIHKRIRWN